jgi:DNA ligase-4
MNDSDDKSDSVDLRTFQKIETRIQDRVNAGYTAPCGWLFRGLTLFFYSQQSDKQNDRRLHLVQNTARFASAESAPSLDNSSITHVVIDPVSLSAADISSLRKSIAAKPGSKIPHLVSVDWVEECWKNGTLLDEERFQVRR